jgi:hypothetical protein
MRRIILPLAACALLVLAVPGQAQDVAPGRKAKVAADAAKARAASEQPVQRSAQSSALLRKFEAWKASVKSRQAPASDLQQSGAPGRGAAAAKEARKSPALKAKVRAGGASQAAPGRAKPQGGQRASAPQGQRGASQPKAGQRAAAPARAPR